MPESKSLTFRPLVWDIRGCAEYGYNIDIEDDADCDCQLSVYPVGEISWSMDGYATEDDAKKAAVAALRDLADRMERGEGKRQRMLVNCKDGTIIKF